MPNTIRDPYPKTKKEGGLVPDRLPLGLGFRVEREKKKLRSQRPVIVPVVKPYHTTFAVYAEAMQCTCRMRTPLNPSFEEFFNWSFAWIMAMVGV